MTIPEFPPLFIYALVLLGFVVTNLMLAHVAGPKKKTAVKEMPYESGMDPIGDARQPFDVQVLPGGDPVSGVRRRTAVPVSLGGERVYRGGRRSGIPPELRGTVFGVMLVFMATLVIAYIYAWRKGVFRWR